MASSLSNRSQEADAEGARDGYEAARADTLVELVAASAANHSHHSEDRDHDEDEGGGEDDRGYLVTVITDADALRADREDTDLGECRIQDGPGLAAETARRIACDAPDVGPPHSSGHADTESMKAWSFRAYWLVATARDWRWASSANPGAGSSGTARSSGTQICTGRSPWSRNRARYSRTRRREPVSDIPPPPLHVTMPPRSGNRCRTLVKSLAGPASPRHNETDERAGCRPQPWCERSRPVPGPAPEIAARQPRGVHGHLAGGEQHARGRLVEACGRQLDRP